MTDDNVYPIHSFPAVSWWRLSLMGHRTIVTRIEALTFLGVLMWRLDGDEMINPATAVFGLEPWDDPRPLPGLPDGWTAQRSETDRRVFVLTYTPPAGAGDAVTREWRAETTETELRQALAGDADRRARLAALDRRAIYHAKQALGLPPGPPHPLALVRLLSEAEAIAPTILTASVLERLGGRADLESIDEHGDDDSVPW